MVENLPSNQPTETITNKEDNKEPRALELKGKKIYPESEKDQEGLAKWVTVNTTQDYTHSSTEVFIPPTPQGAWLTAYPRSLMERQEKGYVQYKGTGNPDKPNFPPRVNSRTNDKGHEVLWAVGRAEVYQTIFKSEILSAADVPHTKLVEVIRIEELPIPLPDGKTEVRSFKDAYLKPWPVSDHVRTREIGEMKKKLIKSNNLSAEELSTDEIVVEKYYELEGFYQMKLEKKAPFKNQIGSMIESLLLMDYLSGVTEYSLEAQANKVVWIMQELGRAAGITELENFQLPNGLSLERFTEPISVFPLSFVDAPETKHRKYRQMSEVFRFSMTDREAAQVRRQLNLPPEAPLNQVNGLSLFNHLISGLPTETFQAYQAFLDTVEKSLVTGFVNGLSKGIVFGQASSPKDSVLGEIGDFWLVGTIPSDYDDEQFKQTLTLAERTTIETIIHLEMLRGDHPFDLKAREAASFEAKMNAESLIATESLKIWLDPNEPGWSDRNYAIEYVDRVKKLMEAVDGIRTQIEEREEEIKTEGEDPLKDPEILNLYGQLFKYPVFLRNIFV